MVKFDDADGVWRTVGGRRIFIKNGQDLASAMKESGKFNKGKKTNIKIKQGDPIEEMAKDRIKEKENTLNNDKILLDGMKKRGLEEINGTTQKDLENRIKKNEEYLKQAKEQEKDFTKEAEKEDKKIHKEPNERTIREELKDIEKERENKDLRGKGLTDDEIDKGYKDVNEALRDKTNSEYEEYKKMRLDDPNKYTNEDIKKFNELDKKYLDRFSKEETQVVRYRDGYAVVQNGGIQKTFDNVNDAKKFESELKKDHIFNMTAEYPRAASSPSFESMGLNVADKKGFSDYLREKYGTDDFRIINFENKAGAKKIYEEFKKKEIDKQNAKYPDYEEKGYGVKYYNVEDALNDPNHPTNQYINKKLRQKAYNKYMKEHPGSKMSFEDFLKKQ